MLLVSFSFKGSPSGKRDSDPRPQPWQGCALPTELFPQICRNFRFGTANIKGKIHSAKIFRGKFRFPPPKVCSEPSGRQMPRPTAAGPRQKPTPRPLPARPSSGPKCRDRDPRRNSRRNAQTIRSPEGEIIRPIGPEPRLHFQAVSGQHPGNELRPLTTDRRGPLPLFQTTVSANAIGPEHPVLPPVRTRLPGNGAVRLAGPPSAREQNPTENADLPARPKGPFRTGSAPTPNASRKTDTPGRRAGGVANLSGNIGLPPKPGPDQRTLNPSSARTGMGRLA